MMNTDGVRLFVARGEVYCALMEELVELPRSNSTVRRIAAALASLYEAALSLPDVESQSSDLLEPVVRPERSAGLRESVVNLFGEHVGFNVVFDPYEDVGHATPVVSDLTDDLVSIYEDVRKVLGRIQRGNDRDALWEARFDFERHWGHHLVSALTACHAVLSHLLLPD